MRSRSLSGLSVEYLDDPWPLFPKVMLVCLIVLDHTPPPPTEHEISLN